MVTLSVVPSLGSDKIVHRVDVAEDFPPASIFALFCTCFQLVLDGLTRVATVLTGCRKGCLLRSSCVGTGFEQSKQFLL